MSENNWRIKSLEPATIQWRGNIYVGHVQEIAPEYSEEIVFLSKSFKPVAQKFVDTIKELDPDRVYLHADDSLELTGRYHLVRKLGNRLTSLTLEQARYMSKRMLRVYELMMDDEVLGDLKMNL
jgi:DNA polymerase elongation subunit (family B)